MNFRLSWHAVPLRVHSAVSESSFESGPWLNSDAGLDTGSKLQNMRLSFLIQFLAPAQSIRQFEYIQYLIQIQTPPVRLSLRCKTGLKLSRSVTAPIIRCLTCLGYVGDHWVCSVRWKCLEQCQVTSSLQRYWKAAIECATIREPSECLLNSRVARV